MYQTSLRQDEDTRQENRVLLCAYACLGNPGEKHPGGGDLMAWNVVKQLSGTYPICVLTSADNREVIESTLRREVLPNLEFVYVDLPAFLHRMRRWQGGIQFYAYLWQWKAYFVARRLHARKRFRMFHHLTYENDWMACIPGALLPIPYLRGPGGGAHRVPKSFQEEYPFGRRWSEKTREFGQWLYRHDPFFILGQERARSLLVCNRDSLEAVRPSWQAKAQIMPVNGVSSADLALPQTRNAAGETFRVLSAGRLIPLKSFDLSIRALSRFVNRLATGRPSTPIEFIIVGAGPERPRLEALVRALGLVPYVRIANWMPRDELQQFMGSCDVFLFSSLRDGGGAVVVEAMAAGLPVICFDHAGPGLHVTAECGIKVLPRSPGQAIRELGDALEQLYQDRELRRRMGAAARVRAEKVYLWDRLGDRLSEIYAQVLSDGVESSRLEGNS